MTGNVEDRFIKTGIKDRNEFPEKTIDASQESNGVFKSIPISLIKLIKKRKYTLPFSFAGTDQNINKDRLQISQKTSRPVSTYSDKQIALFPKKSSPILISKKNNLNLPKSLSKSINHLDFSFKPLKSHKEGLQDSSLELVDDIYEKNYELNYYNKNKDQGGDISTTHPKNSQNSYSYLSIENIVKAKQVGLKNDKNDYNLFTSIPKHDAFRNMTKNMLFIKQFIKNLEDNKFTDLTKLMLFSNNKKYPEFSVPKGLDSPNIKNSKDPLIKDSNDHSYASSNTKIKIYADDKTSELLKNANADAMTLGSNILFARDKFNLKTPRGFALLVHELTHVNQLKNNISSYSTHSDNLTNPKNFDNYWEKEALDNENLTLRYLEFQDRKQKKYFLNDDIIEKRQGNTNNIYYAGSQPASFNSFSETSTFQQNELTNNDNVLGYNDEYAKGKIDNLIKAASIDPQNYGGFSNHLNDFRNDFLNNRYPKNKINNNIGEISDKNDLNAQSYSKNFNISLPNLSYGNNVITDIDFSNSLSRSVTTASLNNSLPSPSAAAAAAPPPPLFAETNRIVDSTENSTGSIQNQILPKSANTEVSRLNTNMLDLESIAEKVYQLIQAKIKIQKARIGIR